MISTNSVRNHKKKQRAENEINLVIRSREKKNEQTIIKTGERNK